MKQMTRETGEGEKKVKVIGWEETRKHLVGCTAEGRSVEGNQGCVGEEGEGDEEAKFML